MKLSLFLFAVLASFCSPLNGQATPDDSLLKVLENAQRSSVFVRLAGLDTIRGRITAVDMHTVRLVGDFMQLPEVRVVERRRTEGGGGLWGALAGGGIVGTVAVVALSGASGDLGPNNVYGVGLLGAVVGLPLGYLVGQKVSPPAEHWTVVWRR